LIILSGFLSQAIWAARIAGIGKRYASRVHEVRAYANDATLGRDGFRERLARAGVRVVEASSAKEAADEQLISDMYALARDQANPSSWVVIVVSRDERLARGIQLARDRGVFTVAVGDFLSAVHRPQFTALRERDGDCGMTESYVTALAAVAANGTTHKKSKLAGTAHETLIWDPRRLFAVTKAELAAHDKVFTANEFGVPIAAPGQCVATWTYGAVEPWTDVD